ncbi:MAG: VOC family protein [Cyanobacteria bacterium P01_F01_bin.3]
MAFEFDHLFICTDVGAAAAEKLISFGLVEGSPNTHPGQGTANRRFFFHNAMLELLWVTSEAEAISPPIRRTHLWERWQKRELEACPFGICLRATGKTAQDIAFDHWDFCPPYLPQGMSIAVATNSNIVAEPMLFQTPFGKRPDEQPPEKAQPLNHTTGLKEITRVTLISPSAQHPSPELQSALDTKQIELKEGTAYCVELGFDRETQGQHVDFRPELPLVIRY